VPIRFLLALIILFICQALSDRAVAQTQAAMTETACNKLKSAETALNRTYEQVLKVKATDADFVKAFREAQAAWVAFRDAHVRAIYPDPDPRAYGTVYPMCRCAVLEQMTTQRARELRHLWVDGTEEGDVCTGSCATRSAGSTPKQKK
jgi:uncharacterized protein YecT (DUF1311 family)